MGASEPGPTRDAPRADDPATRVIETTVNPFHCLFADAVALHTLSRLRQRDSTAEAGRLARAALLLYLAGAEALVHQAAEELGRPELVPLLNDPRRPLPPLDAWALLPAIVAGGQAAGFDPEAPPWPQLGELLALRRSWTHPGPPEARRAYYVARRDGRDFEPLSRAREAPPALGLSEDLLAFPRTGLPRDPYALRPEHLDTARSVLEAAIADLDRRMSGALTVGRRHHNEPTRRAWPPE